MIPRLPHPIRCIRQFETKERNFVQAGRAEAIHEWRLVPARIMLRSSLRLILVPKQSTINPVEGSLIDYTAVFLCIRRQGS